MNPTKWLDDNSKDLRIDWYIEPELAWEERTSQSDGSSSWTRRKISAPRQQHLQVALRHLFAEKSIRHLLLNSSTRFQVRYAARANVFRMSA